LKDSVACTLFEGDYHYGVAALVNSLCENGFKGEFFAGYKGGLPGWALSAVNDISIGWENNSVLHISPDCRLIFLPVKTDHHLTNYKPDFMLQLFETAAVNASALFYFDPDIVVKCKWSFFETWAGYGVALIHERVANDMPPTHPLRKEWEKVIAKAGKTVTHNLNSYINGGFCGVSNQNKEFLKTWKEIFITGTKFFGLTVDQWGHAYDRTYMFSSQDQDALNIAAMCCDSPVSEMGPEAMDFIPGGWVMSHATGNSKPWNKKFLTSSLMGIPPSQTDKLFWQYSKGQLKAYSKFILHLKSTAIKIAALVGRFYSRK